MEPFEFKYYTDYMYIQGKYIPDRRRLKFTIYPIISDSSKTHLIISTNRDIGAIKKDFRNVSSRGIHKVIEKCLHEWSYIDEPTINGRKIYYYIERPVIGKQLVYTYSYNKNDKNVVLKVCPIKNSDNYYYISISVYGNNITCKKRNKSDDKFDDLEDTEIKFMPEDTIKF